jgi:recombination protein RecT
MNLQATTNTITNKPKFSVAIKSDTYQHLINDTLGDPKLAQQFIADISTAVSTNPTLARCEAGSILSAGLVAYTLKLPLSNTLGYAYVIPYGDRATFQVGTKGLIQLAMRSGTIKELDVEDIREGEYLGRDEETGKPRFRWIENEEQREKAKVIGYRAYFETTNGFRKVVY